MFPSIILPSLSYSSSSSSSSSSSPPPSPPHHLPSAFIRQTCCVHCQRVIEQAPIGSRPATLRICHQVRPSELVRVSYSIHLCFNCSLFLSLKRGVISELSIRTFCCSHQTFFNLKRQLVFLMKGYYFEDMQVHSSSSYCKL